MADKKRFKFSETFDTSYLKEGKHTFLLPLGDEETKLIGQIVSYWGAFEFRMDLLLETIIDGMKYEIKPNWKKFSFEQRVKLFKKYMKKYTSEMFPNLVNEFDLIAATAKELQWQRNIVAHGYFEVVAVEGAEGEDTCETKYVASRMMKGKLRFIDIEIGTLQKLWHEISHLTGELLAVINKMGGKISSVDIVVIDSEFLNDKKTGNFSLLNVSDKF